MPPRYAYWTILIDSKPTAFRAREKEELLPTFFQLGRTNKDVVMKWFARGRLWETPEQAHAASRMAKPAREKRGHDWRPGGQHKDPRDRFKKRARPPFDRGAKPRGERPERPHDRRPGDRRDRPSGVAQVLRPAHKPAQTVKKPED